MLTINKLSAKEAALVTQQKGSIPTEIVNVASSAKVGDAYSLTLGESDNRATVKRQFGRAMAVHGLGCRFPRSNDGLLVVVVTTTKVAAEAPETTEDIPY